MQDFKIKQLPEDFIVDEVSDISLVDNGKYLIFRLHKTNTNTETALQLIARALNIDRKNIGSAGNKDKLAVTTQNISIRGATKEKVLSLRFDNFNLSFLGCLNEPLSLGDLKGNHFDITIRNLSSSPKNKTKMINYFGTQRFSINNADIGKAIIKKDFKKAIDLILMKESFDEEKVRNFLRNQPTDFVGALKRIPFKNLKLYVHSFQSYLWNQVVNTIISNNSSDEIKDIKTIPLVGFGTELTHNIVRDAYDSLLSKEEIVLNDFVIKAIPDLSVEGSERELFCEIEDLALSELEDDELNQGKKKMVASFFLKKGCYATQAINELFN